MSDRHDAAMTRREALGALAGVALSASCAGPTARAPTRGSSKGNAMPRALTASHTVVPLPFAPAKLRGLSERLMTSHHENNYAGAVKNLNRVEQELSGLGKDTPPLLVAALRDRELLFRNSKNLHEAYFANLGGDGKMAGSIERAIADAYGTTAAWEAHFRGTAMGLGGGSGWVVLSLELDTGGLRTFGSGNHTQSLATSVPLLVLDMYEHSYHIDFGAAHARYVDAFFENVKWEEVERRLQRGLRAFEMLRA